MKTRIFTCNQKGFPYLEVQEDISKAKVEISERGIYRSGWTCSKIGEVRVGDKAYFYRVASEPCGFFACGRIIAEKPEYQLRKNHPSFNHLSPAYSSKYYESDYINYSGDRLIAEYGHLVVAYEWYSVVDYDKPLSGKLLRDMPEFNGYKFLFRQSGQAFGESFTFRHLQLLDQLWTEHATKISEKGYGVHTPMSV